MATKEGYDASGNLAEGWEEVYDPYTGTTKAKRRKLGGGTGSSGTFSAMPEDNPGMQWDKSALETLMSMKIKDAMKKNQALSIGGGGGGDSIWSGIKNMFGGGDSDSDSDEEETKGKGTGTDWNKWLTFGKGLMDWNTSRQEIELGKEENRLGRDQFDFKKASYAGQVKRKDTEYYDKVNNENQKRKFLNLWLDQQGRQGDRVDYLKNKNYSLPA